MQTEAQWKGKDVSSLLASVSIPKYRQFLLPQQIPDRHIVAKLSLLSPYVMSEMYWNEQKNCCEGVVLMERSEQIKWKCSTEKKLNNF